MNIEIIYPSPKRKGYRHMISILRWCFIAAAYVCPIANLSAGGKPWSIVVLWALYFVWFLCISRDLVEYNRISQTAKLLVYTCVLLVLIDLCLSPGWADFVVPIVGFGSLIVIGILFFSNLPKQKQNMMPMVWLIAASLVALVIALIGWLKMSWPMIALGATAFALLTANIIILPRDMLHELKKRFHTK